MKKNILALLSIVTLASAKIPDEALINLIDVEGQIIASVDKKTVKLLRTMCPPLLHITIEKTKGIYNMPTGLNRNELMALMDQINSGIIKPVAPEKVQPNRYVPKNVVDLD